MSREIDSVVIGGVEDRRIVLGNAQIARKISIGNSWNVLRLGVRLSFDDLGSNPTGTPRLWFGVLSNPASGLTNGPLSVSTSHFVGVRTGNDHWLRGSSPVQYETFGTDNPVKKVGAVVTEATTDVLTRIFPASPSLHRMCWLLEITKGSPNFTVQTAYPSPPAPSFDNSAANLVSAMEATSMTAAISVIGGGYTLSTVDPIAVDESDGPLNAICFAWDQISPKVRVSDFYWSMIS